MNHETLRDAAVGNAPKHKGTHVPPAQHGDDSHMRSGRTSRDMRHSPRIELKLTLRGNTTVARQRIKPDADGFALLTMYDDPDDWATLAAKYEDRQEDLPRCEAIFRRSARWPLSRKRNS